MRIRGAKDDIVYEFSEITQKRHYAVQGHARSPLLIQIGFLLVINTNLPPILHRFRDIAFDKSKIATFGYPRVLNAAGGAVPYIISS